MKPKPQKLNKTIWITEDDPSLGEALDLAFGLRGCTTRYFQDPYRLIKALNEEKADHRPDLIISDYNFSPIVSHMVAMRGDDIHTEAPHAVEDIINKLARLHLKIPLIIFSGQQPEEAKSTTKRILSQHRNVDIT